MNPLGSRLLMECLNCRKLFEVPHLWAHLAYFTEHRLCVECRIHALFRLPLTPTPPAAEPECLDRTETEE